MSVPEPAKFALANELTFGTYDTATPRLPPLISISLHIQCAFAFFTVLYDTVQIIKTQNK